MPQFRPQSVLDVSGLAQPSAAARTAARYKNPEPRGLNASVGACVDLSGRHTSPARLLLAAPAAVTIDYCTPPAPRRRGFPAGQCPESGRAATREQVDLKGCQFSGTAAAARAHGLDSQVARAASGAFAATSALGGLVAGPAPGAPVMLTAGPLASATVGR